MSENPSEKSLTPQRVWLVTGSSRGFGRAIVEAVLEHGDAVVATARRVDDLAPLAERFGDDRLLLAPLDVTDAEAARATVAAAVERFGRLDVVVNNAGYADSASIEEMPDDALRRQIDTNLYGVIHVTRAALPVLRRQRSGLFLQFSSIGGRVGGSPGLGAYQAAKFGVEGFSEVLAAEVAPFGVRVVIAEPGAFRTDWQGGSMRRYPAGADYATTVGAINDLRAETDGTQAGDPARAARLLVDLAASADLPLRLPLGSDAVGRALEGDRRRIEETEAWAETSRSTDFAPAPAGAATGADR
ncbi:SDR family NAD(P)-dependent oxidoreductase [Isoptericola nanjingensis]|uniref:SDR family NAD(P)-dependent oxidoreductase n=1 Tax=Isoptericola nanjingensis TaxID=903413 RepID=UPI003D240D27